MKKKQDIVNKITSIDQFVKITNPEQNRVVGNNYI